MQAAFQVLLRALIFSVAFYQAQAIEIRGTYELAGPCYCGEYGGNGCGFRDSSQRDISVFAKSPLSLNPITENEYFKVGDERGNEGHSHFVVYYSDPQRTRKFRVLTDSDALQFDLRMSGTDLALSVRNLSRPQPDHVIYLSVPPDQDGGALDQPAQIRTLSTDTRLEYSSYLVNRSQNAGGPVDLPYGPKYNTNYLLDTWRIEALGDRVIVTQTFDYKTQADPSPYTFWLPGPIRRFNSGVYSCEFVRKH